MRDPAAFAEALEGARRDGRTVGLVPTMGFFHEGHLSLMRRARGERDVVAVTIFVNPLQFGPAEDLSSYPRDLDRDLERAGEEGVDLVLAPEAEAMWPGGRPEVTVDPGPLGDRYEGASRPGHFRGVLTVVATLFHLAGPCHAYFGEKDAQQLRLIRRMAADLAFPVAVVACPVVREPDGLALSSRNVYLSPEERAQATCLFRGLEAARRYAELGERDARALVAEIAKRVGAEPLARLDQAAVVDEETWEEPDTLEAGRPARGLVAARFGRARLIDTMLLTPG